MDHGLQRGTSPWGSGKVATQFVQATGRKLYIFTVDLTGETAERRNLRTALGLLGIDAQAVREWRAFIS